MPAAVKPDYNPSQQGVDARDAEYRLRISRVSACIISANFIRDYPRDDRSALKYSLLCFRPAISEKFGLPVIGTHCAVLAH